MTKIQQRRMNAIIKDLGISKKNSNLFRMVITQAVNSKIDPFHYCLQNDVLNPLEEKTGNTIDQIRKIIDREFADIWVLIDDEVLEDYELPKRRPTVKEFVAKIVHLINK